MAELTRVGIIGAGYWGPNLIRNFNDLSNAEVAYCCDLDEKKLAAVAKRYPTVRCTKSLDELLKDPTLDAVSICTPVSTHYPLAKKAMQHGKHVLVEKPLTDQSEHGYELIELADRNDLRLMVDHTFIYTPAVRKIRELIDRGELGEVLYFDSVRVNLGLFQRDVNVIWDLAPHDLSIMDYLLGREAKSVTAVGATHAVNNMANMAYITASFADNVIAHFHVNWLAPVKIRLTLIGGTKKMVVYDDLAPSEKVKIYDKGIVINDGPAGVYEALVGYRSGDVLIPRLDSTEALRSMCEEFVASIQEKRAPLTDGRAGLRVVRLLEAAQASLDDRGHPVLLRTWMGSPVPAGNGKP